MRHDSFQWGTEEQKQEFLVPLARGKRWAAAPSPKPAWARTWQPCAQQPKTGSGDQYVLNGEKMWISLASKADFALVTAKTNPKATRASEGLSPSSSI